MQLRNNHSGGRIAGPTKYVGIDWPDLFEYSTGFLFRLRHPARKRIQGLHPGIAVWIQKTIWQEGIPVIVMGVLPKKHWPLVKRLVKEFSKVTVLGVQRFIFFETYAAYREYSRTQAYLQCVYTFDKELVNSDSTTFRQLGMQGLREGFKPELFV